MINVRVGYDDLLHGELVLAHDGENARDIVARINHHGLAGALIADDRAVALQRADGNDLVDHEESLQFTVNSSQLWQSALRRTPPALASKRTCSRVVELSTVNC